MRARAGLVAWAVFLMAGFGLAFSLEPDPRGFGTHQRLGFPPCSFRVWFDIPCPSCGGTTSFSNYVRGNWIRAARSNLAAFGLALVCTGMIPWSLVSAWSGYTWRIQQPANVLLWMMGILTGIASIQWGVTVWLGHG